MSIPSAFGADLDILKRSELSKRIKLNVAVLA